ncbi:MAG: sulfatase-like hydrolase/transferase, partial [Lachnospiraceae bacterium]|nr:sulfatase-like hydrolase/transferase [Lachnospiraceae bacterium]
AYLTDMIDFDKALEYLVNELEKAGIADDTVIVISPDHYAYGLTKSEAFGTDADYLPELYGYDPQTLMERDHNSLIIWSGSLEKQAPIVVSEPVYSVDILPTLLNLFDLEYDSRLLAGRDVFSNALPLVIWPDYSWLTDKGYYLSSTDTFTPKEGITIPEGYVDMIQSVVSNKMVFSSLVLEEDYYRHLFP